MVVRELGDLFLAQPGYALHLGVGKGDPPLPVEHHDADRAGLHDARHQVALALQLVLRPLDVGDVARADHGADDGAVLAGCFIRPVNRVIAHVHVFRGLAGDVEPGLVMHLLACKAAIQVGLDKRLKRFLPQQFGDRSPNDLVARPPGVPGIGVVHKAVDIVAIHVGCRVGDGREDDLVSMQFFARCPTLRGAMSWWGSIGLDGQ